MYNNISQPPLLRPHNKVKFSPSHQGLSVSILWQVFTNMTQKPLSYLFFFFKVMWPDSSNIMHEAEWIIQGIFFNYKRLGKSDNSSMPDKGTPWIRNAENRFWYPSTIHFSCSIISHVYLLYPACPKKDFCGRDQFKGGHGGLRWRDF